MGPRLDSCPQIWPKWEKMDSDRGCGFLSHCPPSLINLSCGNVSNNGIMDMLQFISLQSFSLNGQRANVNAEQALPIDPRPLVLLFHFSYSPLVSSFSLCLSSSSSSSS